MSWQDRPDLIQRVAYHGLYSLDQPDQDWLRRELSPVAPDRPRLNELIRDLMVECDCQVLVTLLPFLP